MVVTRVVVARRSAPATRQDTRRCPSSQPLHQRPVRAAAARAPSAKQRDSCFLHAPPLDRAVCNFLVRHGLIWYLAVFEHFSVDVGTLCRMTQDDYTAMDIPPSVRYIIRANLTELQ